MNKNTEGQLSTKKTVIYSVIIFFMTTFIILALSELAFRYLENPQEKLGINQKNPYGTGSYRLKSNLNITTNLDKRTIHIQTNSHGMHWREVDKTNSPKRVRIAFVGDSFTFGCWADDFQSGFVGVFDRELPKTQYETLNFGVGGYGLDDIELLIREEVSQFHPDYVILAFYNGNDFRDTFLSTKKYNIINGIACFDHRIVEQKVPHEYLDANKSIKDILKNNFAICRAFGKLKSSSTLKRHLLDELIPSKTFTSYEFWSQNTYPDVAEEAKKISLQTLHRIKSFLTDRKITLLIVSIPYHQQVYVKKEFNDNYNIALPQKYVEKFAESNNVPYLDLLPHLRRYVRSTEKDIYVSGDVHFNNHGHKIVGEIIASWFNKTILDAERNVGNR